MSQEEKKEKEPKMLFQDIIAKNFPNLKGKRYPDLCCRESQIKWTQRYPHQDTLELKCDKFKVRKNLESSKGKKTKEPNLHIKETPKGYQQIS